MSSVFSSKALRNFSPLSVLKHQSQECSMRDFKLPSEYNLVFQGPMDRIIYHICNTLKQHGFTWMIRMKNLSLKGLKMLQSSSNTQIKFDLLIHLYRWRKDLKGVYYVDFSIPTKKDLVSIIHMDEFRNLLHIIKNRSVESY